MVRFAGRLLRLVVVGFLVGTVASAIAAAAARRRLVSIGGPDDDHVELVAIFGSLDFRSVARSFRGGSLLSWFAGSQLDLRRATPDAAGADLEVKTIFAATNVVVPEEWHVRVEGPAVFGANTALTGTEPAPGAPELRVRAVTVFGGTSVSARPWDLAASGKTVVIGPVGTEAAPVPVAAAPVPVTAEPVAVAAEVAAEPVAAEPAPGTGTAEPMPAEAETVVAADAAATPTPEAAPDLPQLGRPRRRRRAAATTAADTAPDAAPGTNPDGTRPASGG